ncbi:MAG: hypothetical protein HQK87_04190 [Nitrospinae bacterium]|nr:hypothetical protein [Nitrospinota bacterium]
MNDIVSSSLKSLFDIQGVGSLGAAQKATLLLKMQDDDANGALSRREAGIASDRFEAADADADGQLSADEIARQMAKPETGAVGRVDLSDLARSLLATKDTDKNGGISAKEAGLQVTGFAEADTDGDGELDESELAAHMEKGLPDRGSVMQGGALASTSRSVSMEGALSLLGGSGYSSPWFSPSATDDSGSWFG